MFKYAATYNDWESLSLSTDSLLECRVYGKQEDALERIKKNGDYLELGTLRGDYASKMLNVLDPQQLFLLDIFDNSTNLDDDSFFEGKDQLEYVTNRFKNYSCITILKHDIDLIASNKTIKDKKFDYVYLDIANSYGSFKSQFYTALSFLKPDGILGVNDYTRNNYDPNSKNKVEVFGVIQVVNEFLNLNTDWHMVGLTINSSGYNDVMIQTKQNKEK
jgi:predicted O-methyltransferase YrrM